MVDEMCKDTIANGKDNKTVKKEKNNPFIRNLLISSISLIVVINLLIAWFIFRPNNKIEKYELFDIKMISELTTLECRYHNVAVRDIEGNLIGVGKQYVWFEYDVIIDVGIDINQVRIENPTSDGVVKVYLPPAKILGAAEDKTTISKPVCELGPLTKLTADDERQIINEGIQKLKNAAKTQEVIYQAYNSAKDILEQYIINVGELMGEEYTVEWIKVSEEVSTESNVQNTSMPE